MSFENQSTSNRLLLTLLLMATLSSFCTDMYSPSLPTVAREFGNNFIATKLTMSSFLGTVNLLLLIWYNRGQIISRSADMNSKLTNTEKLTGYRFPTEIIRHVVWLYHRFMLSLRDVSELMLERGVEVSYESIREWGVYLSI